MATIYLHIGHRKTGTTAIQQFIATNRQVFRRNDFFAPVSEIHGAMRHDLAVSAGFGPTLDDLRAALKGQSAEELYAELDRQIAEAGARNVIVSSEAFADPGEGGADTCRVLKTLLPGHEFRILIYLRRQDLALESRYKQYVKVWRKGPLKSLEEYLATQELDYFEGLRPWADAFGAEKIIVRPYERRQMPNGIFADFCEALGIPFADGTFALPDDQNISMSARSLRVILALFRVPMPPRLRKMINIWVRSAFDGKKRYRVRPDNSLMSPQERRAVLSRFEASNAEVARRFLGRSDGVLFFDSPGYL
jgi:hypothetical protein